MPFKYSIHLEQNLIRHTLWGEVTAADLRAMATAVWRDPDYRKRMHVLADLREASVNMSYDDMVAFARFLDGNSHVGRQAIVVTRQLEYGMARMYEQLTEHCVPRSGLRVFFDLAEAEQWIGLRKLQPA